jgi:hypothetical protein
MALRGIEYLEEVISCAKGSSSKLAMKPDKRFAETILAVIVMALAWFGSSGSAVATPSAADVAAINEASSSQPAKPRQIQGNDFDRLIGTEYEGRLTIPGWQDLGGAWLAGPVWHHYYTRDDNAFLIEIDWGMPRKPGARKATFLVTDMLFIPPLEKDLFVTFQCVPARKNVFESVFAVVRPESDKEWWHDVRKAWTVDLTTGKISPIPTKGIACFNEAYGLEE